MVTSKDEGIELFRSVFGNLYIAQNLRVIMTEATHFYVPKDCSYLPFCDDFGPMNLASVMRFNKALAEELEYCAPSQKILFKVEKGRRALSNAVFLLGAYMILEQRKHVDEVLSCFSWLDPSLVEGFRDATFAPVSFELTIADCWRGLARGVQIGWIRSANTTDSPNKGCLLDMEIYEHFDNPLNGDLHTVVPGKLVAFSAPVDLPQGQEYLDDTKGYRHFSPAYYSVAFEAINVTDVVQLNFSAYDTTPLAAKGIQVHQLPFEDCTCPPEDIIDSFLRIVDNARGLIAVHCRAGLGRTGTLIARYLMRSHKFSARAAIGWLRILRPGSVIGPQQQYLCDAELKMDAARYAGARPSVSELDAQAPKLRWPRPSHRASLSFAPTADGLSLIGESLSAAPAPAPRGKAARPTYMSGRVLARRGSDGPGLRTTSMNSSFPEPSSPKAADRPTLGGMIRTSSWPGQLNSQPAPSPQLASQVTTGMAARGAARILEQLGTASAAPAASTLSARPRVTKINPALGRIIKVSPIKTGSVAA